MKIECDTKKKTWNLITASGRTPKPSDCWRWRLNEAPNGGVVSYWWDFSDRKNWFFTHFEASSAVYLRSWPAPPHSEDHLTPGCCFSCCCSIVLQQLVVLRAWLRIFLNFEHSFESFTLNCPSLQNMRWNRVAIEEREEDFWLFNWWYVIRAAYLDYPWKSKDRRKVIKRVMWGSSPSQSATKEATKVNNTEGHSPSANCYITP